MTLLIDPPVNAMSPAPAVRRWLQTLHEMKATGPADKAAVKAALVEAEEWLRYILAHDPNARRQDFQERIYAATTAAEFDALQDEVGTLPLTDPHRAELLELVAMQRAVTLAPPAEEAGPAPGSDDVSRFTDWGPDTIEILPPEEGGAPV